MNGIFEEGEEIYFNFCLPGMLRFSRSASRRHKAQQPAAGRRAAAPRRGRAGAGPPLPRSRSLRGRQHRVGSSHQTAPSRSQTLAALPPPGSSVGSAPSGARRPQDPSHPGRATAAAPLRGTGNAVSPGPLAPPPSPGSRRAPHRGRSLRSGAAARPLLTSLTGGNFFLHSRLRPRRSPCMFSSSFFTASGLLVPDMAAPGRALFRRGRGSASGSAAPADTSASDTGTRQPRPLPSLPAARPPRVAAAAPPLPQCRAPRVSRTAGGGRSDRGELAGPPGLLRPGGPSSGLRLLGGLRSPAPGLPVVRTDGAEGPRLWAAACLLGAGGVRGVWFDCSLGNVRRCHAG